MHRRHLLCLMMCALHSLAAGATDGKPEKSEATVRPGPFLRVTGLAKGPAPVVFRLGATRPEQIKRTFHIVRVLGHLSTVFSPAPPGPTPWDFRPVATSSVEPPKLQAPAPKQMPDAQLLPGRKDDGNADLEVEIEELSDKGKPKRYVERYEDGKPKWETFYKDGLAEGRYTVWHENGRKQLEGQFRQNLRHGTFTEWDEDGRIVAVREYQDGVLRKAIPYEDGKPVEHKLEVLDFKYHHARMYKGYLPIPMPPPEEGAWHTVEACQSSRLLEPGVQSAPADLGELLPYGDRRYHLYVRAFRGAGLEAVRLPIRVELFAAKDDTDPITSINWHSGFIGLLLTGVGTAQPRLESMAMVIERWKRETRSLLAKREGRDLFVAPNGRPDGKGTRRSPLDLQTALYPEQCADPPQPGDTIWLLGGVYEAPGWASKEALERIAKLKRTAKPKDLPRVDTLGLEDEITDAEVERDLTAPKKEEAPPAEAKQKPWLTDPPEEIRPHLDYHFHSMLKGEPDRPIIVRQFPGERAVLNGGILVQGEHAWFWGFEITEPDSRANSARAYTSITAQSPGSRFINLHVHRGTQAFAFWSSSPDAEIYGCVMHDFGWDGSRGHGHAIYTQNERGYKRIIDSVIFYGYGWNLHAYTEGGEVFNYWIEGNFSFSAGMKKRGQITDNWLVMTKVPAHRIFMVGNLGYHPGAFTRGVRFISWGYDSELVLRGNHFFGSTQAMSIGRWRSVECVDNVFWARRNLVNAKPREHPAHRDAYLWDRNTYILPANPKPFNFSGKACDSETWRGRSGFDAKGRTVAGKDGRPTGTQVIVRPNFYEPGRAHVAVLNWDRRDSVDVDFRSFLKAGQEYQVVNVLDLEDHGLDKPVVRGRFDGQPIALPMKRNRVSPDLDVFLILPRIN